MKAKRADVLANENRVIAALAKLGWGRLFDIMLYTMWPGTQAEEMIRRTCVRLIDDGLLITKDLPGTPGEMAYMLTDRGDTHARSLGIAIIGRSHDLQVGERWHEHVMAIAVAAAMRRYGYSYYFAREVAWAIRILKDGTLPVPAHIPALLELGIGRLQKFPDGVLIHDSKPAKPGAAELEWAEKKSDEAADQVSSALAAGHLGIDVLIVYCYPPATQKALLERRNRFFKTKSGEKDEADDERKATKKRTKKAKAIDHEGRQVRNFYARTANIEDLKHIVMMRFYCDDALHYQRHQLLKLVDMAPTFKQALGAGEASKAAHPDWSNPVPFEYRGKALGWDLEHIRSGCWIRAYWNEPAEPDAWSGWTFEAWMESPVGDGETLEIHYPTGYTTHSLDIAQRPSERWAVDKVIREVKLWFLQQRESHLATLGQRKRKVLVPD